MAKRPSNDLDQTNGKRVKSDQAEADAEWEALQDLLAQSAPKEEKDDIEVEEDDDDEEEFDTYDEDYVKYQSRLDNLAKQKQYLSSLRAGYIPTDTLTSNETVQTTEDEDESKRLEDQTESPSKISEQT